MTVEATTAEPVVDTALETPAADAGAPAAAAEDNAAQAEEAEVVQLPANQLQQFIDNQAQMRSQLEQAQREADSLRQQAQEASAAQDDVSAQEAQALASHIQVKETEYSEALLAGEKDKANAIYTELAAARQLQVNTMVQTQMGAQKTELTAIMRQELDNTRFSDKVEQYAAQYPQLDSTNKQYDKELTSTVNELTIAYKASGIAPDAALTKAVTMVAHKLEQSTEATTSTAEAQTLGRKTLKEKLGDATRQPGSPAGKGSGEVNPATEVVNLSTLSDAEFSKLSPDVLKAMRGDVVG